MDSGNSDRSYSNLFGTPTGGRTHDASQTANTEPHANMTLADVRGHSPIAAVILTPFNLLLFDSITTGSAYSNLYRPFEYNMIHIYSIHSM